MGHGKVYQQKAGPVEDRISGFCQGVANVFYLVATLRDSGASPQDVYNSMLASDLPDVVKKEAATIVKLVYVDMVTASADDIGFAAYGVCMQKNTGIKRNS